MSDFNIYFNLFGKYDNSDDWDTCEEKSDKEMEICYKY